MTPQNQDGMPTTGRFNTRQKITAAIVVIVILIVIWQVMGLFGETVSSPPPLIQNKPHTPAQPMTAHQPGPGAQPSASQNAMTATAPSVAPAAPRAPMASTQGPAPVDPNKLTASQQQQNILAQQQETQKQYVDTINQLQMLKLQRDIDETKQSIAAARLATATAEKNISDLFTKPAAVAVQQNPQMSAADYAKLMSGGSNGDKIPPPPIQEAPVVSYTVISVSMRLGHWTAVLGNGGKLYSVSVGDILPVDGSQVVAISKAGVVLKKDNVKRRISVVNSL